ncbi:MAG: cation transporter [Legionellaceae bacterium]|nr:cation transporter [Legionellaceae bacterium]
MGHHHHGHSHSHGHGHGHHHHGANSSLKVIIIATIIIFGFAIIEVIGGAIANSLALWSDAAHMLTDAASLMLAGFAAWIAKRPPSDKFTYGLGRAEVIGATISSMILLIMVIAIVATGVDRLHREHHVDGGTVAIIAAIGLIANIVVAYVLSHGEKNLNIRAAIIHVLGDVLGSFAAIIAGVIIYFTGWMPIDAILSFVIAGLIFVASFRLLLETLSVLMEGVPKGMTLADVGNHMASVDGIHSVHDLHIWTLATGQIMLTAHVNLTNIEHWQTYLKHLKHLLHDKYEIEHITLQPEVNEFTLHHIKEP